MGKLMLISAAAMLTTGCAPGMFLAPNQPYYPAPYATRPAVHADNTVGRWDNVMRLPVGSTIDVLTRDGAPNTGLFAGSDIHTVRLRIQGNEVRLERAEIVRVDLVNPAGSEVRAVARKAAGGAVLGAGVAALFSAVVGDRHLPPHGQTVRAGAALAGFSAAQAEMLRRSGGLIYLAPEPTAGRQGYRYLPD